MTKETKEALLNGASIFIEPFNKDITEKYNGNPYYINYLVEDFSKYQINDEIYFETAKEFICDWCKGKDPSCTDCYGTGKIWDIDKEYKATIKSIKVVKVQDIDDDRTMDNINPDNWQYPSSANYLYDDYTNNIIEEIANKRFTTFIDWYNKQYSNYEDNPYVFLYEVER